MKKNLIQRLTSIIPLNSVTSSLAHLHITSRSVLMLSQDWHTYWNTQGQTWRKEPEIEKKRQKELVQCCNIAPNIDKGIYPFSNQKLSRADVEWLLATHENGHGPINWNDESQRERIGLDLRGANLSGEDLSYLPLARLLGGLNGELVVTKEQANKAAIQLQNTDLKGVQLQGASLGGAQLQNADLKKAQIQNADLWHANLQEACLSYAQLQQSSLRSAELQNANLWSTNLQNADLTQAQLQGAYLILTQLQNATLFMAQLQKARLEAAKLQGASLVGAQLQQAELMDIELGDKYSVGPRIADVGWENTNLTTVDWSQVKMFGEEYSARQKKKNGQLKDNQTRQAEYWSGFRANHQIAIALQNQGLNEDAARFAYRAQVLQKGSLWFQIFQSKIQLKQRVQLLNAWLFSWFLFLLAGYGYKLGRCFLTYLLAISGFATIYYFLGLADVVGPHHIFGPHHLSWYEAFVVSMTAFHGRGFFPGTFSPADPQALIAAIEAFIGLIIEVTIVVTLTQSLFKNKI